MDLHEDSTIAAARIWHSWLQIDRATRAILAERLTHGPSETTDRALATLIAERQRIERAGWFQPKMAKRAAKPSTTKALEVLPVQLRPGDTFTDDAGTWEIVGQPKAQHAGQSVVARVQRLGDPGTLREQWWRAHERITVRRTAMT
jgi:hypothetical protein